MHGLFQINMKRYCTICVCFCLLSLNSYAFNLRKSGTGISGSVINSVFQDTRGMIWVGTNTGVSRFDGKGAVQIAGLNGVKNITGIVTGEIIAETLYGLKLYNSETDLISNFDMFGNTSFAVSDSKGTVFVIQGNGSVYYKTVQQKGFDNIIVSDLFSNNIKFVKVDNGILRIVTRNGIIREFNVIYSHGIVNLEENSTIQVGSTVLFCFESENRIYVIDDEYRLIELSPTNKPVFIADLNKLLSGKEC